jgi:hypothetical protein
MVAMDTEMLLSFSNLSELRKKKKKKKKKVGCLCSSGLPF